MRVTDEGVIYLAADEPLPVVAGEILAAEVAFDDPRCDSLRDMKAQVRDEVAMARVLARRGLPPEKTWTTHPDDPRLAAWRKQHEEALEHYAGEVRAWLGEFGGSADRMGEDAILRLHSAAGRICDITDLLRGVK